MKHVFLTRPQVELLRRAIASSTIYLCQQAQAIAQGKLKLGELMGNCAKDNSDDAVLKAKYEAYFTSAMGAIGAIVGKFCKTDQEFYNLSVEELEQLDDSLHIYLWEKLDQFVGELESYTDDDDLISSWLPELLIDATVGLFPEFRENRKNISFFREEFSRGCELQYYLRNLYPNTMPKSESEKIDYYLDILSAKSV